MKIRGKNRAELSAEKWKTGGIAAALVAAVAVFVVMLQIEKSILAGYERGTACVAIAEIPKGQPITEENVARYFREQELDSACIPETALGGIADLVGLVPVFGIEPGVILTEGMFEKLNDILEEMEEPVIAGFRAEDLYQVAGGVIRAGDRIHIYSVSEDKEAVLILGNVYIQGVFDQTGIPIANGDKLTSAQRMNIYIDRAKVESFYAELARGTLRVVKVCK